MKSIEIEDLVKEQKKFYLSGKGKNIQFRKQQLIKLREVIINNEQAIIETLRKDLSKPNFEAMLSEIDFLLVEINEAIRCIEKWAKPSKQGHTLLNFPGSSKIYYEPFGVCLIIAPWNYPFQLALAPLVGAIAAGNCTVLKPSEISSNVSTLIGKLISENFDKQFIAVVEGSVEETQILLKQAFDFIFYTGNSTIGKIIMRAAAENLTPVVLELGGKSPCIVDQTANIKIAAKRICWGKFFNAGQTCIAPDYLLIHKSIKLQFYEEVQKVLLQFYGCDPFKSNDFARIINIKHFERLCNLMNQGKIIVGGQVNKEFYYIAPTIIDGITWGDEIMKDEIFGPILPVIEYEDLNEIILQIQQRPKPLAFYIYSTNKKTINDLISSISSGGVCINDCISHITNAKLPFGGVGDSGIGFYHGRHSFKTFSHQRAVMKRGYFPDFKMKYPPYKELTPKFRKILRWIS